MTLKVHDEGADEGTSVIKRKYSENPFVGSVFTVPKRMKGSRIQTAGPLTMSDGDGEIVGMAEVRRYQEVDSDRFVKVFVSQLNAFMT